MGVVAVVEVRPGSEGDVFGLEETVDGLGRVPKSHLEGGASRVVVLTPLSGCVGACTLVIPSGAPPMSSTEPEGPCMGFVVCCSLFVGYAPVCMFVDRHRASASAMPGGDGSAGGGRNLVEFRRALAEKCWMMKMSFLMNRRINCKTKDTGPNPL